MDQILTWLSSNLGSVIVPIVCVLLTYVLTVRHERKKDKAVSNKMLQMEIDNLRSQLEIYETTSSSQSGDFLVRKENGEAICPVCWRADHKAIPIYEKDGTAYYICGKCGTKGIYNYHKVQQIKAENEAAKKRLLNSISEYNSNRDSFFR